MGPFGSSNVELLFRSTDHSRNAPHPAILDLRFLVNPSLTIIIGTGSCSVVDGNEREEPEAEMDVRADTNSYEAWLARFCPLDASDLAFKHEQLSNDTDPFPFFRGTYYRWARLWAANCPKLLDAPRILAIGDLHLENYGTWRDADGRLCWGVNDFDEVDDLPYTNDLVRLAASTRFAKKAGLLDAKFGVACEAILDGYRGSLTAGGKPFVLETHHPHLRAVAMAAERDPIHFWTKLTALLAEPAVEPPDEAKAALVAALPGVGLTPTFRVRSQAGVGSLGKPRYVVIVEWCGGWICREAKAVTPPATAWVAGQTELGVSRMGEAVRRATRSPDPFYQPGPAWVTRRLAPHCSRIELAHLASGDVERVLHGMGAEVANVHLGTKEAAAVILRDLSQRPANWLMDGASTMADATEQDWAAWRRVE